MIRVLALATGHLSPVARRPQLAPAVLAFSILFDITLSHVAEAHIAGKVFMPRLSWDLHSFPEGHHTVSWGKGVTYGEQYFVPKHDGSSRAVILPLYTQYLPKSREFIVGAQRCPGISKIDEQNALEIKEAKGDEQFIGGNIRDFGCRFLLAAYNASTGKHVRSRFLGYAADNASNAIPLGFYLHEPAEDVTEQSNEVMIFYWHQAIRYLMNRCVSRPLIGPYFRTNGYDGPTEPLEQGASYRRAFGDDDEAVKRDPFSTKQYFIARSLPVCRQDLGFKEQGTTSLAVPNNEAMKLVYKNAACWYMREEHDKGLLPLSRHNCMDVPFNPSIQLGRYFVARFTANQVTGLDSAENRWAGRLVKPIRNFARNTFARVEKGKGGSNTFAYYFVFFEMITDARTKNPWQSCTLARAETPENSFRFFPTGCLRCADAGIFSLHEKYPPFTWCASADKAAPDRGLVGPLLVFQEAFGQGKEKAINVMLAQEEAKAPPMSFVKEHFYNWIRDVAVIPISRKFDVHVFYVCDMYPTLEDFRFGPVAYSQLSYRVVHMGARDYQEVRHRLLMTEVFSPELTNLSVVLLDMENELFMLLYENAIDQIFNAFLITAQNDGTILEGADLMFPDAKPESYNSFAYGTRFELGLNDVPYKIQLSRPTAADALKDFRAPSLPDGNATEFKYFQRLRATHFEGVCEGTWNPPLQHAPCTADCFKFQTFRIGDDATAGSQSCPWNDGTLRAVPCASRGCSWVRFDVSDSFLRGSVDRNIKTGGAVFTPGSVAPVTFDFKTVADVSEVLLLFKGHLGEEEFDIEIAFLDASGQEFSAISVRAGGLQFTIELPFDRSYIRRCDHHEKCAEKSQHTRVGTVVKSPPLQVFGVKAVSVVYHGRTVGAELLEINVKGREEHSACPPHGFFADPRKCPQPSDLLIPQKLADLDCQGFWTEWTTCDHFCRQLRFFSRSRDPLPGGKPCPLMEHRPCDEGMYCKAADVKFHSIVDGLKDRHCEIEEGEWSDCVNCRELKYTHVLMQAARRGKACPEQLMETRFCSPTCEELFSTSTGTTTATTTSTKPTTTTGTTTSTTSTTASQKADEHIILGIVAGNAALFILVLSVSCCFLFSKSRQFRQSLEARRKALQLKKDVLRVRVEAAAAVQAAAQTMASQTPVVSTAAPQPSVVPSASLQAKRHRGRHLASPRSRKTLFPSDVSTGARAATDSGSSRGQFAESRQKGDSGQ